MYVVVNAAMSADGKLSTRRREQVTISGPDDFDRVDRVRTAADAVMVGIGTVLADDPHLTIDVADRRVQRKRHGRPANPARVVADSQARTPPDARILDDAATTYLLVAESAPRDRKRALADRGAELIVAGSERVELADAVDQLSERGIARLMIEGGGELIFSAFADGLVDELTVYVGSLVIGGRDAPTLADGDGFVDGVSLTLTDVDRLDDGVLLRYDVAE